jgi:hypothetical protein
MSPGRARAAANVFGYTCTTLQHPDCEEGQRLLDAYLRAVSAVDAIRHRNEVHDCKTVQYARNELIAARRRYWTHVRKHRCRKTRGGVLSPHGESS